MCRREYVTYVPVEVMDSAGAEGKRRVEVRMAGRVRVVVSATATGSATATPQLQRDSSNDAGRSNHPECDVGSHGSDRRQPASHAFARTSGPRKVQHLL